MNNKIKLPSKSEQQAIVSAIESRLSECDKLEKTIDDALTLSASLRQSILKKAFEGRLVPQDPNDEPAEKLLERIKVEKAVMLTKQKQVRKNGKNHRKKVKKSLD
jgi:type I restriction enzyme S subunit